MLENGRSEGLEEDLNLSRKYDGRGVYESARWGLWTSGNGNGVLDEHGSLPRPAATSTAGAGWAEAPRTTTVHSNLGQQ